VKRVTGEELLRLPVRVQGIRFGRTVDVLLHPTDPRALGIDVLCRDDRHRFLPLAAATVGPQGVEVSSALVLLDLGDDSIYRLEARALSDLRGMPIAGRASLQDVVLGPDWASVERVREEGEGSRRVPLDGLALPPRGERRRRAPWLPRRKRGSRRRSR
jgi:hypothetical protein